MSDEFLHRLRKEPSREFAGRLRAQLKRQAMNPPPRVSARLRTLLTLLLLGGTAFAITAVMMRGLPPPLVALYERATAWVHAERIGTSAGRAANQGVRERLGWPGWWSGSSQDAAQRGRTPRSTATAPNAQGAATSSAAGSSGSPAPGGAMGSQIPQIRAVSSWAAYPYAAVIADNSNRRIGTTGKPLAPYIDVSVKDSDLWPEAMCSGGADAPNLAFTFQSAGTVSQQACPRNASGSPNGVIAIPIGYEALILARSPLYGEFDLTRRQLFLALARWVPDPARAGIVHENTSTNWRQIDATLGAEPIEIMGPPLSSPAGRSMIELLVEAGCNTYPWLAALRSSDPARYARICRTVRTGGVYTEISRLWTPELLGEPNAVGIMTVDWRYAFPTLADMQPNGLTVGKLDGAEPTPEGIQSGTYPGSQGFYLYVRSGYVVPNLVADLLNSAWLPYADWAVFPPPEQQEWAARREALTH